jgi:hypothetical protein
MLSKTLQNSNNPQEPKKPSGFSETQITQHNPNNPQEPDLDLDLGFGNEFENGGGNESENSPPPQILKK